MSSSLTRTSSHAVGATIPMPSTLLWFPINLSVFLLCSLDSVDTQRFHLVVPPATPALCSRTIRSLIVSLSSGDSSASFGRVVVLLSFLAFATAQLSLCAIRSRIVSLSSHGSFASFRRVVFLRFRRVF
ncbi:hypothetical protein R3P38DRAFT_3211763 [Favolaschia claudopus]|uniref:Uncharacterized protein n=1 Tax=Favolaschia claudopus TaxID=2862362 RepID=A0AAW0AGY4_9AGAR